ncbi:MAG: AAA family ATPase [Blastocatellia bacterium]|nr:AAA family ATPase [Blastocatellia bacterium]
MHISRFQLNEYKCFHRSEEIRFEPGINIIVGQNNVGKSAFLEALGLRFTSQPYKSSKIVRSPRADANLGSWANLSLTLSKDELFALLPKLNQPVCVPIPPTPKMPESEKPGLEELRGFVEQRLFARELLAIDVQARFENNSLTICHQSAMQPDGQKYTRYPAIHYFDGDGSKQNREFLNCNFDLGGKFEPKIHQPAGEESLDFGLHLARYLKERVYTFRAERMDIHKCAMVYDKELRPNAINLSALLLQLNPRLLDKLNQYLCLIFPQIHRVFARMIGGAPQQEVEIFVSQFETTEEEDFVSLGSSGTGLSQVLAILYLVICAKEPSVLIIDEPQSFLHPGAARKLIEILSTYPQHHQYIIATHSPALIAAAEPATVTLITKEKGEPSKLTSLDGRNLEQLNFCLAEVGARLSDVFGYDRILWVEGETERECFPLILRSLTHKHTGTAIVPVHNPGDLVGERSDPRRVLGIYKRLCEGKGLLPPALGFVFDSEGRSDNQIEDLQTAFAAAGIEKQRVQFLPRRMYENYLLDSRAITAVLRDLGKRVEESAIAAGLERAFSNTAFEEWKGRKPHDRAAEDEWIKAKPNNYFRGLPPSASQNANTVHAADVLSDLFAQFDATYRKIEAGRMLTQWLLNNDPDALSEIRVLLDVLFSESACS